MLAFNVSWGPELTSLRRWCPEIDTLFPCRNSWVAKGRRENVPMKISLNISIAVDYTSTKVYAVIGWPCIQDSFRWGTLMTLMILSFGVTGKFEIVETMFKNILVTQWDQQCKKKINGGAYAKCKNITCINLICKHRYIIFLLIDVLFLHQDMWQNHNWTAGQTCPYDPVKMHCSDCLYY